MNQEDVCNWELKLRLSCLFYWSIISAKWDQESKAVLLRMTVDLWVTIRGFSLTSAWVERYKSMNKTGIQKSKGLRKKLL